MSPKSISRTTTLCLACSASLPPKSDSDIFLTRCCKRPICPACLSSNPRLARYDPCLSCLGGVGVVSTSSQPEIPRNGELRVKNVDGAVREEDVFVLGDDEDDAIMLEDGQDTPPPPYSSSISSVSSLPESSLTSTISEGTASEQQGSDNGEDVHSQKETQPEAQQSVPSKYYIKPGDTLLGIALRFGVDGRALCRLNNLPASTLTTTPHLLHTRGTLTLPPSAKVKSPTDGASTSTSDRDQDQETELARERAQKRLQTLTKEVDWRVARAYVSLADDPEEEYAHGVKLKERASGHLNLKAAKMGQSSSLEERAIDQYLDDEEWEQQARREGREATVSRPPWNQWSSARDRNGLMKGKRMVWPWTK